MSRLFDPAHFWRDHRWAPDHMSDYLDGELSAGGQDRMQRHLGECGECRRLLAGLRAVVNGLHSLPSPKGGPDAIGIAASVRLRLNEPRQPE